MASKRQLEANRQNALLSSGPRTIEGISRSRANSLKHGLSVPISETDEGHRKSMPFKNFFCWTLLNSLQTWLGRWRSIMLNSTEFAALAARRDLMGRWMFGILKKMSRSSSVWKDMPMRRLQNAPLRSKRKEWEKSLQNEANPSIDELDDTIDVEPSQGFAKSHKTNPILGSLS